MPKYWQIANLYPIIVTVKFSDCPTATMTYGGIFGTLNRNNQIASASDFTFEHLGFRQIERYGYLWFWHSSFR
jgi:hypothetical protein